MDRITFLQAPGTKSRRTSVVLGGFLVIVTLGALTTTIIFALPNAQAIIGFHQSGAAPRSRMGLPSHQPSALTSGLLGWWKMDEGWTNDCSTTSVADSSGNSNNGKSCPNVSGPTGAAAGKFGSAGSFDGIDDEVNVANTIAGVKTVAFWVNPTATTANMLALDATHYISATTGTITATNFTSPTIYVNGVVSSTLVAGAWQHVVVTTGTGISASAITMGLANSVFFAGSLDDVRMYSSTLAAADVTTLYSSSGAPLCDQTCISWWKFDETASTTAAVDSSGQGHTGTLTNFNFDSTDGWKSGIFANSLQFDGSNDYVNVPNNTIYNLTGTDHSFAVWILVPALPAEDFAAIFFRLAGGSPGEGYAVYMRNATGRLTYSESADGGTNCLISPTPNYADNTWHHIVVTVNTTSKTGLFYVDGKFLSQCTYTGNLINHNAALTLGGNTTATSWQGYIDDLRIYTRVLQPYEIYAQFVAGR